MWHALNVNPSQHSPVAHIVFEGNFVALNKTTLHDATRLQTAKQIKSRIKSSDGICLESVGCAGVGKAFSNKDLGGNLVA